MKVMIFAAVIELPDSDDTKNDPALVPNPTQFSPDELLRRLIREAREGRNPEIWSNYGPIFEV